MITINSKQSIYELVTQYPEIKEVMVELGFRDMLKPGMLQTMGKVMTIEKGARMKKIPMAQIVKAFADREFQLI